MNNEITLYSKFTQPAQIIEMGVTLGRSGNFGFTKAEQGVTMLMMCMCDNMSIADFLRTYHVMENGKFSKKGMAVYAEFLAKGGKLKWISTGDPIGNEILDTLAAEVDLTFDGQSIRYKYSIADAKREGLWGRKGSRYQTSPGEMLRSKIHTKGIPLLAPGLIAGEGDGADQPIIDVAPLTLDPKAVQHAAQTITVDATVVAEKPTPVETKLEEKILADAGLAPTQPAEATTGQLPKLTVLQWDAFAAGEFSGKLDQPTTTEIRNRLVKTFASNGMDPEASFNAATKWLTDAKWIEGGKLETLSLARAKNFFSANGQIEKLLAKMGLVTL